MQRLIIRVILKALAFIYLLPMIHGIQFHGTFLHAIGLAIFFSMMLWAVEALAVGIAAIMTVSTFGLALLMLIPLWIFGFWIMPAIALKLVADLMPAYLSISGWLQAVVGGLVLLFIGMITGTLTTVSGSVKRTKSAD